MNNSGETNVHKAGMTGDIGPWLFGFIVLICILDVFIFLRRIDSGSDINSLWQFPLVFLGLLLTTSFWICRVIGLLLPTTSRLLRIVRGVCIGGYIFMVGMSPLLLYESTVHIHNGPSLWHWKVHAIVFNVSITLMICYACLFSFLILKETLKQLARSRSQ